MIKIEKIMVSNACSSNCWICHLRKECIKNNKNNNKKSYIKVNHVGLCKGRHNIPQVGEDYIFNTIEDVTDAGKMYSFARQWILANERKTRNIKLYVTGLTPALCCFISAARDLDINLITMHYDTNTQNYFEIPV